MFRACLVLRAPTTQVSSRRWGLRALIRAPKSGVGGMPISTRGWHRKKRTLFCLGCWILDTGWHSLYLSVALYTHDHQSLFTCASELHDAGLDERATIGVSRLSNQFPKIFLFVRQHPTGTGRCIYQSRTSAILSREGSI